MMHGPEKSDPAIVAMKPANKRSNPPRSRWSEGQGPRGMRTSKARTGRRAGQTCHRRWNAYGRWPATASPSHTQGGRSYGAGGGGCGTFIVHTNRWRLPRGPNQ